MVCKSRYWGFLVYPSELEKLGILDSWIQILEDSYEWVAISPLHDKDLISKGDRVGEFVKPHYHVLFVAPNSTTSARCVKLAFKCCFTLEKLINQFFTVQQHAENYFFLALLVSGYFIR